MAELSKVKRPNRVALLKKVQEQPMPPARVPLHEGAQEHETTLPAPEPEPAPAPEPAPEPAAPEPEPAASANLEKVNDPETIRPPAAAPKTPQQAPPAPAPEKAMTRRHRFSLRFDNPALLKEATAVAESYGVPLAHIIKAIAQETKIAADDFKQAPPPSAVALRPGGGVRVELSMDSADADGWLTRHDPLRIQPASIVLRPVAVRAFERTAPQKLAALKKEK